MNWYYIEQGQQVGPVTDQQLQQLFQSGSITADTLVWRQDMANWTPYSQVTIAPGSPAPEPPPPLSQTQATPGEGEVVCAECGKLFPAADTVRFGKATVCAACKPIFLQKLSEGAHINTGELHYAGFWIRFGAKFIDGLIIGIPMMVIMFAIMIPAMASNKGNPSPAVTFLPSLVQVGFLFVNMCYQIFFLGKYGATPGKMACKIKVVTSDGAPITYGRAAGRFFSEILSGLICDIGYIIAAFDEQKRALHDHICTTRVVYK